MRKNKLLKSKSLLLLLLMPFAACADIQNNKDMIENISAYHNNSKWQKISAQETFEQFFTQYSLSGNENLLDACSGDGKVSALFAAHLPNGTVLGLDRSPTMVDFATNHYGNKRISFKNLDIQKLPYHNQFDVITSFTCLHLIPDVLATFKGFERSLKPGGKILIQFPYDHSLRSALDTVVKRPKWRPYFQGFELSWYFVNPEIYQDHLNQSKLKTLRFEMTQKHEFYVSRAEFEASISHWLPHTKFLAEPLREDFMEDLIDLYLESSPSDADGYVHYFVDRIEIEAMKDTKTG